VVNAIASPLHGADGNREFLVHCRQTGQGMDVAALEMIALTPAEASR
jgi:hypothetical protein